MKSLMLIAVSLMFVSCASTRANLEKAQKLDRTIANTPNLGQVGQFNMSALGH